MHILIIVILILLPRNICASGQPVVNMTFETDRHPITSQLGGASLVLTFKDQWGKIVDDEVSKIHPPVLRFPAGTHAMYYDWETGKYSPWPRFRGNRELMELSIDKFFGLAKKYNAEVSYIVNVYQDTPQKTGRLAQHIKSKGFRVRYWELGNEAYASQYSNKFPDVSTYIKIASEHASEITAVFPDAEIGIVAENQKMRFSLWNRALAKQIYFENIIIHRYHGPERSQREKLSQRKEQISVQSAYKKMLEHSAQGVLPYKDIFPGKKFWITEWGTLYLEMDVQNSMAHAIWMARTFLLYFRSPEITMAAYWDLNARPFELIYPVDGKIIHRIPFYVYDMVISQLRWAKYTAPVQLAIHGRVVDLLDGQLLSDERGNRAVLIVNATGRDKAIKLPIATGVKVTASVLGSDDVGASNGHSMAFSPLLRELTYEVTSPKMFVVKNNIIFLPPFAVALLKWTEEKFK